MNWKEKLQVLALILVVFGACWFIFDHFLVWTFHLQVIAQPCGLASKLCEDANPRLAECFQEKSYVNKIISEVPIQNFSINFSSLR